MELLYLSTFKAYTLGLPPTQDASHHQDYYIFSRESQPKPSFATVTGWGVDGTTPISLGLSWGTPYKSPPFGSGDRHI